MFSLSKKSIRLVHSHIHIYPTHSHTLGLTGQSIKSCLANMPFCFLLPLGTFYFLSFPYRRWSVFSFLCEVCRPLCPHKTMFLLFTFWKGWLEDAPAFREEIKELLRHAGQVFPFHLNILFVTVRCSTRVKKVSNHCRKSTQRWQQEKRKDWELLINRLLYGKSRSPLWSELDIGSSSTKNLQIHGT